MSGAPRDAAALAVLCRRNPGDLPAARWISGDMRRVLPDGLFGAIIGWDHVFHLDPAAQRALIPRLVARLAPGGRLLVRVGPRADEAIKRVGDAPVYHASRDPGDDRARCMAACCARAVVTVAGHDCDVPSLLTAQRPARHPRRRSGRAKNLK